MAAVTQTEEAQDCKDKGCPEFTAGADDGSKQPNEQNRSDP
jgi:hypothetical protein